MYVNLDQTRKVEVWAGLIKKRYLNNVKKKKLDFIALKEEGKSRDSSKKKNRVKVCFKASMSAAPLPPFLANRAACSNKALV